MIPPQVLAFFSKPLVKFGLPVLVIVIAVIGFRIWLADYRHDVRAEYLIELTEAARKESEKAAREADKAADAMKGKTDAVQNSIANSTGVDDLFGRLRATERP